MRVVNVQVSAEADAGTRCGVTDSVLSPNSEETEGKF